jgi:hypothetical protein
VFVKLTVGDRPCQGCQICIDKIYQNGGKYTTKLQMAIQYTKLQLSIPNGNKTYQCFSFQNIPNKDFGYETLTSGIPGSGSYKIQFCLTVG